MENKKTFSYFSFGSSLTTILILAYLLIFTNSEMGNLEEGIRQINLIRLMKVSIMLGVTASIFSFIRKEPKSIFKYVGTILNFLMLTILIAWFLFFSF